MSYRNSNNKYTTEKFKFHNDEENIDDFDFQYVPVTQFKHIIKDVRRQRIQNEEERVWTSFLNKQEETVSNKYQTSNKEKPSRTLAESIEDVDRELMRLKVDASPEIQDQDNFSVKSIQRDSTITKENGSDSTNFLLTIPEEGNICYTTASSDASRHCIRKSSSDQNLKKNRVHSRNYHYNINDYNSSLDLSPDRFSDQNQNDSSPVYLDPLAVTKILAIQRKISCVIDSISIELDRIPLPDGEQDFRRRQQRVVEFSTRLSRNYLYDLGRQITDIQRHIKAITPSDKIRLSRNVILSHMQAIEQKLITTHQLLLTALSAYWKHIPSSVLKNHPGKLSEILQIVVQLKNICIEINLAPKLYSFGDEKDLFLGKETENRCSIILSKFRQTSDNESQVPSLTTRSTIITPSRSKKRNRKILANRLSMYTVDMRSIKNYQPKKSNIFQISRDKKQNGSVLKHQQSNMLSVSKKSRLYSLTKAQSENLGYKSTKICLPPKEDEIQTIMETVPSDLDIESPKTRMCEEVNQRINIYCNNKDSDKHSTEKYSKTKTHYIEDVNKKSDTKEKDFSSLLSVMGDLLLLVQNQQDSTSLPSASINTLCDFIQKCQPKVKIKDQIQQAKIRTELGRKNVQLICCSAKNDVENKQSTDAKEHVKIEKMYDASCQVDYLKNTGKHKLLLSESAVSNLNEYKNHCQYSLKYNPMYTNNTQNKPWEVVGWIADKLVDELIVEISEDFQIKDVIQRLFHLEFQEF